MPPSDGLCRVTVPQAGTRPVASRTVAATPLAGQVGLVTGGGRGVGRVVARGLAAHGMAVGLLARTAPELEAVAAEIAGAGGAATVVVGDVTDRGAVERAVARTEDELGPLTLLVNNAGTCDVIGPLAEVDPDAWWREVEIHVRGAMLASRAALAGMLARRRGRIVNVYGSLGDRGAGWTSAYAVAKASLLRLTEQMAVEGAAAGVRAFALHPGLVDTAVTRALATGEAGRRYVPAFSRLGPDGFPPTEPLVRAVVALASGTADALSGRLVAAWDDVPVVAGRADRIVADDERALRVTGYPPSTR